MNFKVIKCILGQGRFVVGLEYHNCKLWYNGTCTLYGGFGDEEPKFTVATIDKGIDGPHIASNQSRYRVTDNREIEAIEEALMQKFLELEGLHEPVFHAELNAFDKKVEQLKQQQNGH